MSIHEAKVVKIQKRPHPDADTLSLTNALGYTVVVKSDMWEDGQLAVFVEPDTFVDTNRPEFNFLANDAKYSINGKKEEKGSYALIRAKKLRKVVSYGLLVPAPEGAKEGDDCYETLGLVHYQPGEEDEDNVVLNTLAPPCYYVKYDVESLLKNKYEFQEDEPVVVTPKLHGTSFRMVYVNDEFYVGSRKLWYTIDENNLYCNIAREDKLLMQFCRKFPAFVVYGEIFGAIQKGYDYGLKGKNDLALFDIARPDGNYVSQAIFYDLCNDEGLPFIPSLSTDNRIHFTCMTVPYNLERLQALACNKSRLGGSHVEEGIVVKAYNEPRRCYKLINPEYLLK